MTPAALPEPPTTTPAGNFFCITDIWQTGVFTELLGNVRTPVLCVRLS